MRREDVLMQYFGKKIEVSKISTIGNVMSCQQIDTEIYTIETTINGSVSEKDMAKLKVDLNISTTMQSFIKSKLADIQRQVEGYRKSYEKAQNQVIKEIQQNQAKMQAKVQQNNTLQGMASVLDTLDFADAELTFNENLFDIGNAEKTICGLQQTAECNEKLLGDVLGRLEFYRKRLQALYSANFEVLKIMKRNHSNVDFLVFEIRFAY